MTATFDTILQAAMQLSPDERCQVAARLWDSAGDPPASYEASDLESLLDAREAEMDADPSMELSHEAFLVHFAHRRA
jgi:putative addiction module component (TIGR02574 family)